MIRDSIIAVIGASMLFGSLAQAQTTSTASLPAITTQSLDEKPFVLPRDLPADRTLVLLAFERAQKPALETWISGLNLADGKMPWIEVVVVGPQNAFVHAMITRGMRRESDNTPTQRHLLPVFADQEAFAVAMGVSVKSPYAVIVDRAGHVLAASPGDYSATKAQALMPGVKP